MGINNPIRLFTQLLFSTKFLKTYPRYFKYKISFMENLSTHHVNKLLRINTENNTNATNSTCMSQTIMLF